MVEGPGNSPACLHWILLTSVSSGKFYWILFRGKKFFGGSGGEGVGRSKWVGSSCLIPSFLRYKGSRNIFITQEARSWGMKKEPVSCKWKVSVVKLQTCPSSWPPDCYHLCSCSFIGVLSFLSYLSLFSLLIHQTHTNRRKVLLESKDLPFEEKKEFCSL